MNRFFSVGLSKFDAKNRRMWVVLIEFQAGINYLNRRRQIKNYLREGIECSAYKLGILLAVRMDYLSPELEN